MANYFTINEFTQSETARKKKIDNTPEAEALSNIQELIAFLNPIREAWGSALTVASGYRCSELNKAIGGVSNSSHLVGYAVDIVPKKGTPRDFYFFLKGYLKDIKFDQVLLEKSGKSTWCHISLKKIDGQQRRMFKEITV